MEAVKRKKDQTRRQTLLLELKETRAALERAYSGFNFAEDSDLISAYIYEIKSQQARYSFLLRQIKSLEAEV